MKRSLYGLLLGLVSISIQSCATQRINHMKEKSYKEWKSYQWKEVKRSTSKDEIDWVIFSRKIEGTNFLEYKIESEFVGTPQECLESFREEIHIEADKEINKKYPTYNIVEENDSSLLTYVIHKEPFPLKNTEMSVRYWFKHNNDGGTNVEWTESWEECPTPKSRKLNRVETFRGSWNFTSKGDDITSAENSVSFDLRGMPLFLAEPMVTKFLIKGLKTTKKSIQDKRAKD